MPPEDHLPPTVIDDISGPITAQILEFCETDLFPETLQNSEVNSSSNCCYDENSSFTANLSFSSDLDHNYSNNLSLDNPNKFKNDNSMSIIFDTHDELDTDIAASIDFSTTPPYTGAPYLTITQQDHLDFSSEYQTEPVIPFMAPLLPPVYQEDCLSMMPPYPFFDPSMGSILPGSVNASLAADNECHGDSSGMFCPDQIQQVYNSSDIQSLSNDNQQHVNGAVSTPMSSEISNLEESTLKPGKLSVEQKKEKIHRYLKKRNERNFNKKIKYACRKTLADSRPRVRGRFAKNDEFGDVQRHISSQHEEDEYEEVSVKEEYDVVDSSDIFAHISGVNSYKCGYSVQSWI